MKKIISLTLLALISFHSFASNNPTIMQPINQLFDAMRAHDSEKLLAQFTRNAQLQRVTIENSIRPSNLNKFAEFVGQSEKHLDEKLFGLRIMQSGNLASVWAPFAFYLDGKLSHCGVNSIQLVKQNNQWKIHYLIDNVFQGDCQQFITQQSQTN
ncbi:hypothetical protein [Thalassotalea sp. G2M2-11]|uniref:hypothetical protein n=1 Tax=Thalassotalea sp. G2M2-11 TaxID=2787627 RepID=UPI0019D0F392|nr:hypothetical protein [Thalassotalea sp. G2M2-11]